MSSEWVPEAFALFSADGTVDGYAVVADNTVFWPGAECFLSSDNTAGQRGIITDLVSTTKVGIRFVGEFPSRFPGYGRNSLNTNFTLALHAAISMPSQVVRVQQPTFAKISKVS